jgi:hypothetical protein
LAAQPVGVISLVGEHDGVGAQMTEQPRRNRAVAGLAGRQDQCPVYLTPAATRTKSTSYTGLGAGRGGRN